MAFVERRLKKAIDGPALPDTSSTAAGDPRTLIASNVALQPAGATHEVGTTDAGVAEPVVVASPALVILDDVS